MRITTLIALVFIAGLAYAEPAKKDAKTDKPPPGPIIKVPPLPPQLDGTLFSDVGAAKFAPVSTLPKGAQGALIGTDPNNGGMAGWLKLPPNYRIPPAWETHMTNYVVVSGTVTITSNGTKHALSPGGYVVLTSKDKHEISCGAAECLLLVHHLGPPDMHWVNPADAPKAK